MEENPSKQKMSLFKSVRRKARELGVQTSSPVWRPDSNSVEVSPARTWHFAGIFLQKDPELPRDVRVQCAQYVLSKLRSWRR